MIASLVKVVLAVIFVAVFSEGFTINQCDNGADIPFEVTIQDCPEDASVCEVPCVGDLEIRMSFKAPRYLENITPNLIGNAIYGKVEFNVTQEQKNACWGILNTLCPLMERETVIYKFNTKLIALPLIPIHLQFELVDEDKEEAAICFKTPISPVITFKPAV